VPPFEIERLYPEEVDGTKMRTYFHWLALAYGITLTGHPAISIPCGLEPTGTPMHLQIVGPRGGDAFVLSVALALERAMAGDPALARPVPDLAALG
jgi:Asp-tRNA(Asn)/Glu-tRNA(Gln) amidotransferase A subunit family amidase